MRPTLAQRAALRRVAHKQRMAVKRVRQDNRDTRAGVRWKRFVEKFTGDALKRNLAAAMVKGSKS